MSSPSVNLGGILYMKRKIIALLEVDDDTAFQKLTTDRFHILKKKWNGWNKAVYF